MLSDPLFTNGLTEILKRPLTQSPHSQSISKIPQLMVTPQASSTRSLLLECNGQPTSKTLKLEQMPWSTQAAFFIAETAKPLRNGSPPRTYLRNQSNGSLEGNKIQSKKIQCRWTGWNLILRIFLAIGKRGTSRDPCYKILSYRFL